ncbi:MAG TPA: methionyl-tRNA formyltransferase [Terriglobia bacterium]|nr:methionyl-tRNA formyltransferase [Terriglobia bacterium]
MRLIFCGTPQFAVPTLEALIASEFEVRLVLTNPDEPRGRGYELKASPVKEFALNAGLRVFQPARLKDSSVQAKISAVQPDAIVVVAYGHIIPSWMIELPRHGCVNLHASLLPRYRGAAPVPWAVIRGERITGVTTMQIDAGLDTGGILLQRETEIRDEDTTETLLERLSKMGAGLMVETLHKLDRDEIHPLPQDERLASYAPMLKKEDGRIDWSLRAEEIGRRVRGLRPWPVAYTAFRGRMLRLWAARPADQQAGPFLEPGALTIDQGKLITCCGSGTRLELIELQLEGRRRISARDFLNGVSLMPDDRLGN